MERIAGAIASMDRTIHDLVANLIVLVQSHHEFDNHVTPALAQTEEAFKDLEAGIGSKSKYLPSKFDSPNLWSTIGVLTSELQNISNQVNFEFTKELKPTSDAAVLESCNIQDDKLKEVHSRVEKLSKSMLNLTKSMQELYDEQTQVRTVVHSKSSKRKPTAIHDDSSSDAFSSHQLLMMKEISKYLQCQNEC